MRKDVILYSVIAFLVGTITGYFAGRAHIKYEFKKGVKNAFGAFGLEDGSVITSEIEANEESAIATLKTQSAMLKTYKNKGYSGLGRIYPVGNDSTVTNSGKFCGLYYEVNNAGEKLYLVQEAEAKADCRADGDIMGEESEGTYIPCINTEDGLKSKQKVTFNCSPYEGYWFGLMKYYYNHDEGKKIPYDKEFSKHHFALVAFPADYGRTGKKTFIINEEGAVYSNDFGEGKYRDTYPGPSPVVTGWLITK